MAIRVAALALAFVSGRFLFAFGQLVRTQESLLREAVSASLFGIAAHLGLFLTADMRNKPLWYRRVAFILMLPTCFFLGASVLEAARRLMTGNPLEPSVMFGYFAVLTVYVVQLVVVMRTGLGRNRRATAAS
jgi:hypothetical protein